MKFKQQKINNQSKNKQNSLNQDFCNQSRIFEMSSGYFSRTSRNTPQRNLDKSQQVTQASTNPSQISNVVAEQTNKGGYVYKPPTKIMRSNVNAIKQVAPQKTSKVEQKVTEIKNETLKQTTPVKSTLFVRKSQNQTPKVMNEVIKLPQNQIEQTKQQPKPITKPISRLNTNRQPPKAQQKSKQQQRLNSKSMHALDLKKPSPYSYPKKISRRGPQTQDQPQQNKNIKNQQKFQQTPKFNRLHRTQQPQSPPTFSLPYQRKGANQTPQSSQSHNSLRNSQSSIKPPSQNLQPTKSISKVNQNPSKPLIPHSSRYSNKIQTPRKEQQVQQNQVQRPQIKRSNLIAYSLQRICVEKLNNYFEQICNFSQNLKQAKENQKSHRQFEKILSRFCQRYENGLIKNSFVLMKLIYSKLVKVEMTKSVDPKSLNQLILKRDQCFVRVLENITLSQLAEKKQAFSKLKDLTQNYKLNEKKILNGAKILSNKEFKRLRQCFGIISDWNTVRKSIKSMKLAKCSQISKNLKRQLVFQAFRKIQGFKIDGQSKGSKKQIPSKVHINKLKSTQNLNQAPEPNKLLKQKVIELQKRLQELKRNAKNQAQGQKLKLTITELTEQNQAVTQQLQAKKQKNTQLKQRLQSLMANKTFSSQEDISSLSDNRIQNQESTLPLLHEIYMKAYKQSEEQCISEENIVSLFNIHRVEENKTARKTVAQWLSVQENLVLKHWINLYEGNYVSSETVETPSILQQRKSHLKKLQQENEIIQKFIRSYIKQRYMWEQVKQYVAAVIHE